MSEPMTSGEIEDVLSSIRRLVSEDLRPPPRMMSAAPQAAAPGPSQTGAVPSNPAPARSAPEKLLLTPALRVVERQEAPVPRADTPAAPVAAPPTETTQRLRLDAVVASIGAAVSPPADGWEPETGDATVTRLSWVMPPPRDDAATAGDGRAEDRDERASDDAGMAEDAPATGIAGLHFARQAERAGRAQGTPAAHPVWPDAGEAMQPSGDPIIDIDEGLLRDLVRDMIREELQGPMGERITRNIRKLVRSEIGRMITARDLE